MFASNFARSMEEKVPKSEQRLQGRERNITQDARFSHENKNPHFNKRQGQPPKQDQVQPMDIDSSSRFRQSTQSQKKWSTFWTNPE